jgi:uncharacterized protein DUF1905/bacteriocin resistance YdeI/OmpD-like protein
MPERFQTTLRVEGRTATFFEVPLDVPTVFGRARTPVRVTIGGHAWIAEAKREETRRRRIAKTLERLRSVD